MRGYNEAKPLRQRYWYPINALKIFKADVYLATETRVYKIKVIKEALKATIAFQVKDVINIRLCLDSILFISQSQVIEYNEEKTSIYDFPDGVVEDARIFNYQKKQKMVVVFENSQGLEWKVYELSNFVQIFQSTTKWEILLDISHHGRLFVHNNRSHFNILDPLQKKDTWVGSDIGNSGENNSGGIGCFLEHPNSPNQVLFAGIKYYELAIAEKFTPHKELFNLLKPYKINHEKIQQLVNIREMVENAYRNCLRELECPELFFKSECELKRTLTKFTKYKEVLRVIVEKLDKKKEDEFFKTFRQRFCKIECQAFEDIQCWYGNDEDRVDDDALFTYIHSAPSGVALVLNWKEEYSKILCLRYSAEGKSLRNLPTLKQIHEG
jgi:hypothetical protein